MLRRNTRLRARTSLRSKSNLKAKSGFKKTGSTLKAKKGFKKKAQKLNNVSERRKKENAIYAQARKAYLLANPHCERCLSNGVITPTSDLHHKAGREGKLLFHAGYFASLCRSCHSWVHANASQAEEDGWIIRGVSSNDNTSVTCRPEGG